MVSTIAAPCEPNAEIAKLPMGARVGLQDLSGSVRQEQILGVGTRRRATSGNPRLSDRIELRQDGQIVGEHRRCFGRDQTVFDPWHYVPVLARKPGALRNSAPIKNWVLPGGIERVRRKLAGVADGDRQMVSILTTVLSDGLLAVEAACLECVT